MSDNTPETTDIPTAETNTSVPLEATEQHTSPVEETVTKKGGKSNKTAFIAVGSFLAVIGLILGLVLLITHQRDNTYQKNEQAASKYLEEQGAVLDSIDCKVDTCSAIISGSAYTILIQEDKDGKQHFGVTAYVGDSNNN